MNYLRGSQTSGNKELSRIPNEEDMTTFNLRFFSFGRSGEFGPSGNGIRLKESFDELYDESDSIFVRVEPDSGVRREASGCLMTKRLIGGNRPLSNERKIRKNVEFGSLGSLFFLAAVRVAMK